jgi:hypothetical protein
MNGICPEIGHVDRLGADHVEEHLHEQMMRRRRARRGVAHLAVLALDQRNQVRERRRAEPRIGDQSELRRADEPDRCEILHGVVGQRFADVGADRHGRDRREKEGVAVGRGTRGRLRRNDGAGTGPIVDHKRLLELVLQLLRQDARQNVGAAAGRERTDEVHRALRIVVGRRLRQRGVAGDENQTENQTEREPSSHASSVTISTLSPMLL